MAGSVGDPSSPDESERLLEAYGAARLPILAVDDRVDNLVALRAVLAPLGLEVVSAGSGEEALRLLLEHDFALILLDVRMPGLDGLETARLIKSRERSREVPIVFLTAVRDEVSDMVRGYDMGAVDYVLKPFDEELLRSKVAVFAELEHRRLALRHSEGLLRGAFEAAPIGKTLVTTDLKVARANPAFARLVGRDQDELVGLAIAELCHQDDRPVLAALFERASSESPARPVRVGELAVDLRLLTGDGRQVWVAPTASSIQGTEFTSPLLLVQWVDVDARRRAEQTRAELLLEQAARSQAEAQARRLEKLQRLLEALESTTLDELLAEVAHRLVEIFDAEAAEVQVDDGGAGEPILCASGGLVSHPDSESDEDASTRWEEEGLYEDGTSIGAVRVALASARAFSPLEHALLRDAANHVSLLVRRMQLHEREHGIATELQRGLLPTRIPELPGVDLAAHCQAAGLAAEVGGDWYDVFLLSSDRMGIVIGDVTGSGIRAASAMGQLRSVTRAFALGDPEPSPAEVLTRLHRYHQMTGIEELFTVLYLILDRTANTLAWANAGHPPALLRARDGSVRTLEGSQSLMSLKDVVYEDQEAAIEEGDTLIVYTDGLVERRGEAFDAGLERLQHAIQQGPDEPDSLCSYLIESSYRPGREDDVTALVVRIVPRGSPGRAESERTGKGRVQVTLTPDAAAPALARRTIERSFGEALDPRELERAKLAVSELTTNAVVHGQGEITILADLDNARLMVEVVDQGTGFEHVARERDVEAIGGRGLTIVDAETSRWGMHEGTTHVWFEIERRGPRIGTERRPSLGPHAG
jgi:PAS domain S-box-containing protein